MQLTANHSIPKTYSQPNSRRPLQATNSPSVQFGFTPFLTGWFMSGVGEVMMSRVMHTLLNNLIESSLPLLAQSPTFEQGKSRLQLAQNLAEETEAGLGDHSSTIKEYLNEAESRFLDASTEVELSALKAECFRYAALCAKLANRPQRVIKDYANQALFHYKKGRKELKRMIKQNNPVMDLLKVVSWPISYPLIVSAMLVQWRPVTDLPEYTQRLLFPNAPEQRAILQRLQQHENSTLPQECTALRDGKPVEINPKSTPA